MAPLKNKGGWKGGYREISGGDEGGYKGRQVTSFAFCAWRGRLERREVMRVSGGWREEMRVSGGWGRRLRVSGGWVRRLEESGRG